MSITETRRDLANIESSIRAAGALLDSIPEHMADGVYGDPYVMVSLFGFPRHVTVNINVTPELFGYLKRREDIASSDIVQHCYESAQGPKMAYYMALPGGVAVSMAVPLDRSAQDTDAVLARFAEVARG